MAGKIEDYALIGDCETAALVSRAGSIEWLCWPRFDSEACFAALLGTTAHGHWLLGPADRSCRIERRYLSDTLILETDIFSAGGVVKVIDFMPVRERHSEVIRLVTGVQGEVAMRCELIVRMGYGRVIPWAARLADGRLGFVLGPDRLLLRAPVPTRGEDLKTVAEFTVRAGETLPFVLTHTPSHSALPGLTDVQSALRGTERFWRSWMSQSVVEGEYASAVRRSLITLKALTHRPTGSIVAAPTASLPERLGGSRNWDYRYCWLRDATFTLQAMMNAGYYQEATQWRDWLLRAIGGDPDRMQIMYGVSGERRLPEWQPEWLEGYEHSKPVRIGNAAFEQKQLDTFGEVMDALHQGRRGRLVGSKAGWTMQKALVAHLETIWQRPDRGMWETRGQPQLFTSSRVMAWVALDRVIQSAEQFGLDGPVEEWRRLRTKIHEDVCAHGYDAQVGAFVQSYGSKHLDAGLLLIALVGFLPAADPRVQSTVAAIERQLTENGLVRRSVTDDGLFLPCSFWLADNYVLQGRTDKARALLERLLSLRNDVGLLAEEYDARAARLTGNFPQALSHIALINTVHNLTRDSGPARQRSSSQHGYVRPGSSA